jgi:UDP-N-acetylmuramoylalanine--D-glutamate ligase
MKQPSKSKTPSPARNASLTSACVAGGLHPCPQRLADFGLRGGRATPYTLHPSFDPHLPFNRKSWKGINVLIFGLGQFPKGSGISSALTFAKLGANLVVTDAKQESEIAANVKRLKKFKNATFVLGEHRMQDIEAADLIVANPRVRPTQKEMVYARKLGKIVTSDIALFLDRCPAEVIAVTGTRGKSTTSTLIAEMLKAGGRHVWLGGNILVSPLTFLSSVKKKDIVVLELSSWQCESLGSALRQPHISVVTNMMRDHLNTYIGMEDYAEAKAQIFRHQKPEDFVVLNADDAYGKEWIKESPSEVRAFGKSKRRDASYDARSLYLAGKKLIDIRALTLIGEHNIKNVLAASLAASLAGVSRSAIQKALKTFKSLESRLEKLREVKGVTYINDTCATTPDGAIAAYLALKPRYDHLWFIMGGADKVLDYKELADTFEKGKNRVNALVLPGVATEKLVKEFLRCGIGFERVSNMHEAVARGRELAMTGDAVILSPAAASFGLFKNEFDRGEQFMREVKRLK